MNGFLDDVLVGLILLGGFGYATYALGPRSVRARLLTLAAAALGRLPAFVGTRHVAARLVAKSRLKSGGACGGCDDCGADAAPATKTTSGGPAEVRVPVAKIGKRR